MPSHDRSSRWGGAIAGWELTRLARRGSPAVARVLVALFLFTALLISYLADFPDDLDARHPADVQAKLSRFGQEFSLYLLLVQAAVVLVLTPLFVAGSIVEESIDGEIGFLLPRSYRPHSWKLGSRGATNGRTSKQAATTR